MDTANSQAPRAGSRQPALPPPCRPHMRRHRPRLRHRLPPHRILPHRYTATTHRLPLRPRPPHRRLLRRRPRHPPRLRPPRRRLRVCGSTASISRRSSNAGIIANPYRPATGLNWGQLFTDHANQVQLNQLLLTANKPLDPKNPDYQWGFKVQFMYGSDARYTQFLGELNRSTRTSAISSTSSRRMSWRICRGSPTAASTSRSASIRRRLATRRSIPRPIRSTRTPTSSSSACRSSTPARWRRPMSMTCSTSTPVSTPARTPRSGRWATTTARSAASAAST